MYFSDIPVVIPSVSDFVCLVVWSDYLHSNWNSSEKGLLKFRTVCNFCLIRKN